MGVEVEVESIVEDAVEVGSLIEAKSSVGVSIDEDSSMVEVDGGLSSTLHVAVEHDSQVAGVYLQLLPL
jgi:hypothetical protein